jgi:hypothetical protein
MTRKAIEELATELHEVYMKEATRQGDVRHAEDYSELPENIKEFDRALARFILSRERLILEKIGKLTYAISAIQMLIEEDIEERKGFTFNRKKMLDIAEEALK